ncbi:MAG TPA: hypothetical protein VNH11_21115 [Pirellulales bacterium]|nr:hypothetical protein [Pirellulales bacterium]
MSEQPTNVLTETKRLRHRIKRLYDLLNERKFDKCFEIVDPRLRTAGKITLELYQSSLSHFIEKYGPLHVLRIDGLKLHIDVPARNEDRDFAYALVVAQDAKGREMAFRERWVRESDGFWYTRKLGLV